MTEWLKRKGYQGKIDMAYIEDAKKEDNIYIQGFLRDFILLNNIQAVIISTEPLSHLIYIHACLQNNVSILLDKPITLEKDIVNDPRKADKIRYDYAILKNLYLEKCEKHKLHFDVMAQRRYHQ